MWGHARCICCPKEGSSSSSSSSSGGSGADVPCSYCYVRVEGEGPNAGNVWTTWFDCDYDPDTGPKEGIPANCDCIKTGLPALPDEDNYPANYPAPDYLKITCTCTSGSAPTCT